MKVTDFLTVQSVIPELKSREKNAVLEEMAHWLVASHPQLERSRVLAVLRAFARSAEGVDFASLDGEPTYLFFALIAPENAAADHLKALARISRLLKDEAFRSRLMGGETAADLYSIIAEEDEKF